MKRYYQSPIAQILNWIIILTIKCLVYPNLQAQEINKDYIYGCENCTITSFRVIGKYKVLFNYNNIDHRMLTLLDTQNLVVDQIQVQAPMGPCPYGENGLLIPDLGYAAYLKIENDKFTVEKLFRFQSDFNQKYGGYYLVPPKKGFWSITSTTCGSNKYVAQLAYTPTNQENFVAFFLKNPYDLYKAQGKEIPMFTLKNYTTQGTVNENLTRIILANKNCEDSIKVPASAPGFHSYDIDGDMLMVFLKDFQKLFYIKMDSLPQVKGNVALPLPEPGGWRHFYDLTEHLSYFLFEKKEASDTKGKSKLTANTKLYKLYRLDGHQLTKVSEVNYLPVDIEGNRLYELRTDKKSYHIYGHPLVPIKDDIQRIFIKPEGG